MIESNAISEYAEHGDWELLNITIRDYASNSLSLYQNPWEQTIVDNIKYTVNPNAPIEEVEIDDGSKALEPKSGIELNKEFTITFNMDVNLKTFIDRNVYVLDQSGSKVPLMFIVDRMPLNTYRSKSTYTLYVKNVYSTTGIKLEQNTKMKFTTK